MIMLAVALILSMVLCLLLGVPYISFLRKHTIATMSCKASLKAHDYLNLSEMQFLLDNLYNCENPSCCPHGRPTIISFTKYQLEKLFKRTGV